MADKDTDINTLLQQEKEKPELDDSIFMGQMDLLQEVEAVDDSIFPGDLLDELTGDRVLTADEKTSLFAKVKNMNTAEKIKLALTGNKEARDYMVKEQNKMILRAVMKNPRMQINEVTKLAQSRNVNDEILRLISQNREWTKTYTVKRELVYNPRTPQHIAMTFFRHLREADMKGLMKNKDVSNVISRLAKKHFDEQEKKKQKKVGGH